MNKKPEKIIHNVHKEVNKVVVSKQTRSLRSHIVRYYFVVIAIVFAALSILAANFPYFPIDLKITRGIQTIPYPWFSKLMQVVSLVGYGPYNYIMIGGVALGLVILGFYLEAIVSTANAVVITLLGLFLKSVIHRPRPTADLVRVFTHLGEYSFPSGHVLLYTSFFGFLLFLTYTTLSKKSRIFNIFLAVEVFFIVMVGPSRIFLGAHWASDVTGAYMLGSLWVLFVIYVYEKSKARFFRTQPVA